MERNSLVSKFRNVIFIGLFVLTGSFFLAGVPRAAGPDSGNVSQVEATVIHIDNYAVYAPNLVFYFDTQMEKRKTASLARSAEQLRNRKALITYSSTGDTGQAKRFLLLDIAPAGERSGGERGRDVPRPAVEPPGKRVKDLPEEEAPPQEPIQLQVPQRKPVVQDRPVGQKPEQAGRAILKEEATEFVRRLLALNEMKDLPTIMTLYAEQVDYYDRGTVPNDYVKRDLGYYFRNWHTISTSLDGDVVMIVLEPDVRTLKFTTAYYVKNDKKTLTGKTENIWKIQRINGHIRLIDVKQRTVR